MAAMILASVTTLVLISGFDTVLALSQCGIDCSGYNQGNDRTDDPADCHRFYYCFSGSEHSDTSFNCPPDEDFDTITKQCKKPSTSGFQCTPPCEKCTFDCSSATLGRAANVFDCSVYYVCDSVGGIFSTETCPSNAPYFNGITCQSDKNQCCSCRSECLSSDVSVHRRVPDYKNCTNFYLCVSVGITTEDSHGHCPRGNFNSMTGECEEDAPCIAPCQDSPNIDTCETDDSFVCPSVGYFPKCTTVCDPHYYYCTLQDIGRPVEPKICTRNHVIDPLLVQCVSPEQCPCPCAPSKNTR
ncbi:uncharacterized protein [Panulirus ornatus]|uniref:uncharacterized protein n=1 Tax=Panulirus ornatus TaxID=150431 RepID=UPI003A8AAA12